MTNSSQASSSNNMAINSDEYVEAQRISTPTAQDTFNFDASDIGSLAAYGDFEEYSGPAIN